MNTSYVQRSQCEATQIEDDWVILDTNLYTITKINDVGGFCWSLLNEPKTLDSLVDSVTEEFYVKIPKSTIQRDIENFLSDLLNYGLVEHAS